MSNELQTLARWIADARRMVGFSGAGISTDSGVPDFRSPGSPWLKNQPIPFAEFMASADARKEAWRRKFAMDDLYAGAKPSAGHTLFAHLVAQGRMFSIITQNIDGLHEASGVPTGKIIELHGNGTYARCLSCGLRKELSWVRQRLDADAAAPTCDVCDGIVKSATISFGQSMPVAEMERAKIASESADLFLVVGSSLVVYPAAGFPLIAKRSGAKLVIINKEPTELDKYADLVIHAGIRSVAHALLEQAV